MLMVEKIEQAPTLMEAPSLQDLVKPYCGQYKTTVGPKIVAKSRTWLVVANRLQFKSLRTRQAAWHLLVRVGK